LIFIQVPFKYKNQIVRTIESVQYKKDSGQAPVAHACDPSYSGGKDQEDSSSKAAGANSSQDLISKKHITKIGLVEWLKM
jgi:hypothetical protein